MTAWVLFISAGLLVALAGYLSLKNISEELDREYEKRNRPARQPVYEGQRRAVREPVYEGQRKAVREPVYEGQRRAGRQPVYEGQRRPVRQPVYEGQRRPVRQPVYEGQRRPVRQPVYEGQRKAVRQPVCESQRRPARETVYEERRRSVGAERQAAGSGRTVTLEEDSSHGRRNGKKSPARFLGRASVLFLAVGLTYYFVSRSVEAEDDVGGKNDIIIAGSVNAGRQMAEDRVLRDEEPPVIQGVRELTMTAGGSISYKKGVTVTDNFDRNVELTVDSSAVDTLSPGDYNVIYIAVDASGNRAVASSILHVLPVTVDTVTEEVINAEADKVLATILKDSMSQYEKAEAIYNWCHSKIAYSDGTPKTNWVQGAYRGIVERKGDCYTYAAAAKCLLTRAGIANMDIEKIPANSMHYWNLIDIGEGWHHFDTCRRKDGSTFFYKTDAELMEYSDTHGGTHNYDRKMYPDIV